MLFESKWITYKTGEYKSTDTKYGNPSPYFRQKFSLKSSVKKAGTKGTENFKKNNIIEIDESIATTVI